MEVKVGVLHASRELAFESQQTPDEVQAAVDAAFDGSASVLALTDDHGRRFLVPADRLAYVEIGESVERRVGFGTS